MAIHRSSSAGVLGWFARRLAQQGLVSLVFANSSKAVAAHGGKVPFFGTNPFAFGSPRDQSEPVVFDMATASTARVNLVRAAAEGVRRWKPGTPSTNTVSPRPMQRPRYAARNCQSADPKGLAWG